jgi:hypothetical protein
MTNPGPDQPTPEPAPSEMPTGEDFLTTFYRPELVSTETKGATERPDMNYR